MIVSMKKAFLIVLEKERRAALRSLRKLGVLHVETIPGESTELNQLLDEKQRIEEALMVLREGEEKGGKKAPKEDLREEPVAATVPAGEIRIPDEVDHLLSLNEQKKQATDTLDKMNRKYEDIAVWGDYDPGDVRELLAKNIIFRLYDLSREEFSSIEDTGSCFILQETKTRVKMAFIAPSGTELPQFHALELPEYSLSEVKGKIQELAGEINDINETILHKQYVKEALTDELEELESKIEFETAHLSMGVESQIAYLKGFVPVDSAEDLKDYAGRSGWGILLEDPAEEDQVPTKLKNPKWVGIIQPIFNFIGTVPGYRENDISFFFLIFFSIFFAMIIGDAGYGTILFIGALLGIIKSIGSKKKPGPAMALLMVLSLTTMGWGAITGTWFGSEMIANLPFFRSLIIRRVATFDPRSSEVVKYICFVIGTIQISIAHIWNFIKALKEKPRIKAIAQLGWFVMVLGLFYMVLNLVLDTGSIQRFAFLDVILKPIEMPRYGLYMIFAGIGLVMIFGNQEGKFFKGILKGLGGFLTLFLDSIGAFSDIISYIRLFAVGLASVEIAKSFNAMAAGGGSGVAGIIGGAIILILGHSLNLAMGALSVIVHGVRLNMLEFSGHLGMEWTGLPYSPLRERGGGSEHSE